MTRKVLTALSCARLEPHEVLPRPPYHPFPSPHDSPFTHIILPGARGAGRGRGAFCTLPAPLPGSPAVRHQVTTGLRIMYRNDAPQKKKPRREAGKRILDVVRAAKPASGYASVRKDPSGTKLNSFVHSLTHTARAQGVFLYYDYFQLHLFAHTHTRLEEGWARFLASLPHWIAHPGSGCCERRKVRR